MTYKNKRKEKQKLNGPNSHTLEDKLNLLLCCSKTGVSKSPFKTDNTTGKLLAKYKNVKQTNSINVVFINSHIMIAIEDILDRLVDIFYKITRTLWKGEVYVCTTSH